MDSSAETDADLRTRVRQQEFVAELGQRALEADDLDRLIEDAVAGVAETLAADYCAVFEYLPDGRRAWLRHGAGWRDGSVGDATVPTDPDSQVGATLDRGRPVVVEDFPADERFAAPDLLARHDVTGGVTAVVGSADDPWGVLGAYATERREFTEHDADFVRRVGDVLGSAVRNERTQSELEEIYGRISDAFFALDREWRFTYVNERAHEVINPEGRALVGENIWEAFPEATSRKFESEYERAMYEQETASFEEYYPEPLDAWFEVRAYPSETGLSVYFRDVTERKRRERELHREQRHFEAVFEDPNILVGLLDPDGTVLDINGTAMEYVDADLDAVTGEPFWETPWWGEGDEVQDDVREWTERAAAGEYVDFEADLTQPDGERYTLNGVFRPVTDDDGEVVSIIVSDRDITERKKRERKLEESERRYRTLAEYFPNGLVTLFDHDLRYTLAAGQGFEDIPVDPDDIEGNYFRKAWDADTADALEPALEATLDGNERSIELEYEGREWVLHAVPITDERGDVFAGMTMAQDVTERVEAQRKLEESERRYRTLVENFPNGAVALFDGDMRFTAAGGEVLGDVDTSASEIVGQALRERFPDELAAQLEPHFRAALCGESNSVEMEFGDRHWYVHTLPVEDDDGDVFAGMMMAQDVTEQVERERKLEETVADLEESNDRLESFASMLAHELRNPVTIGQIYSQQLPDGTDAEAVEYVTEAFDRIEDMIDVMLVLTRGREAVSEGVPVDLADVARAAWADVGAPEASIDVEVDRTVRADETYVRHLFRNLLENSVEHGGANVTVTVGDLPDVSASEASGGSTDESVGVSAERSEDEARQGAERTAGGFYVADDGDGIPDDDYDAVFEEGYTTTAGQGGTGLGLAFVQELADIYGWECSATESEAGGARFEFRNVDDGASGPD